MFNPLKPALSLLLLLLIAAPMVHAQANLSETLIKVNAEHSDGIVEGYWRFVRISADGTEGQTFGCPIPPAILPENSAPGDNWSKGSCTVDFGPGYAGQVEFQLYERGTRIRLDIGGMPYISLVDPASTSAYVAILSKYRTGEITILAAAPMAEPGGS